MLFKGLDLISMPRPFIREPFIIKKDKENKKDKVACVSCNHSLAAVPNDFPIHCYNKNFPKKYDKTDLLWKNKTVKHGNTVMHHKTQQSK